MSNPYAVDEARVTLRRALTELEDVSKALWSPMEQTKGLGANKWLGAAACPTPPAHIARARGLFQR